MEGRSTPELTEVTGAGRGSNMTGPDPNTAGLLTRGSSGEHGVRSVGTPGHGAAHGRPYPTPRAPRGGPRRRALLAAGKVRFIPGVTGVQVHLAGAVAFWAPVGVIKATCGKFKCKLEIK